jgi:hypothetical protein
MRNPESGPDLSLKLRCNDQSTWWRPRDEFKVFGSVSVAPRPANAPDSNILVIAVQATDETGVPSSPDDWFNSRCKKLCLKLFTQPIPGGEPDVPANGIQPMRSGADGTPSSAGSGRDRVF